MHLSLIPRSALRNSLTALALLPLITAHAATDAADTPPARRLGAPSMMKLDWGVDSVRAADLDGDRRTDLAALNNDTGRIEILLRLKAGEKAPAPRTLREDRWNPVIDDAPFRRLSITGAPDMGSLALADLDGDGRTDIAFTSSRDALTVVSRDKAGEWSTRRVYTRHEAQPGDRTLAVADLDGSGAKRLLMLSKSGLLVFPKFPATGPIPEPRLYRIGTDNPEGLSVADIDGDGRPDVAYRTRGDKPELRVRFGLPTGGFGPERAFRTEYASANLTARVPAPSGGSGFAGVSLRKRAVEIFDIRRDERAFRDADAVSPALYAPASPLKSASLAALADIAGDGRPALIVGDARGAALRVFRPEASGDFGEPVDYPAPANLTSIAAGKFDGKKVSLLLLGEKDGTLGHSTFDANGRPSFPAEVKLDGTPVALACADIDGDGRAEALVVLKSDKGDKSSDKKGGAGVSLVTLAFDDATGAFKVRSTTELDAGAKDATGVTVGDFGGDALPDIVVLTERDPARLLLNRGDAKFEIVAKDSATRKGMLSGVTPADLAFGDIDGDGLTELLVSAPGFVRSLRVDAKGDLVVKDQFNARRPGDRLKCPAAVKLDGAKPGLLAYNDTDKGLEWLAPDDAGVFRHRRTIETGSLDPLGLVAAGGNGAPARLVHVGKDRVAVTDLGAAGLRLSVIDRFETDLPGIVHGVAEVGRFTGGAAPDLALIDPRNHHIELVRSLPDARRQSSVHWSLFDENQFYRGRRNAGVEPHDGLAADLDGDGFPELVLLMHDRLIVYPSEPATEKK